MNRGFKGVWIPKEVWESKELTLQEKVLLAEIESLDNEKGCYASNDYFADFFGISKRQVSRIMSNLKEKGYIEIVLRYKKGTKQIEKRVIKIVKTAYYGIDTSVTTPHDTFDVGYGQICREGIDTSVVTPIDRSVVDNSTSFNNTFNSTTNSKQQRQEDIQNELDDSTEQEKENPVVVANESFGELIKFYAENVGMITPMISEELGMMADDLSAELALLALKESVIANARNKIRYAQSILNSWKSKNYKTVSDVENAEKRRNAEVKQNATNQRSVARDDAVQSKIDETHERRKQLLAGQSNRDLDVDF